MTQAKKRLLRYEKYDLDLIFMSITETALDQA